MNLPRKKGPDAPVVRKGIRVKLDMPRVLDRLKTAKDHTKIQELADMVQAVEQMPGAKAGYVRAQATGIDSESAAVTLGPAVFSSRILAKSLAHGGAAFALLATLGPEARKTAQKETDLLKSWWWQGLFDMALEQVVARVTDEIKDRFSIKCLSILSPGSLEEDWPLDQQRELFCLLDGLPEQLGVTLSEQHGDESQFFPVRFAF